MSKSEVGSKPAVTIRSVAKHAGVSPMSVSNVLNGRRVSAPVHEAVERSIRELNYIPNPVARQLSRGSTLTIGILYGPDEHPMASAMLIGALTAAARHGAQLLPQSVAWSDPEAAWGAVRALVGKGTKALLLPTGLAEDMAQSQSSMVGDLPIAAIASGQNIPSITTIRIDDVSAACDMTSLLIGKGHKRIGFIRSLPGTSVRESRYAGYLNALQQHAIAFNPNLVREARLTFEGGLEAAASLLDMDHRPSAIFASNDDMAAGALVAAHMRKLAIPEQIAIAGFDDSFLASRIWPALTSIHQPITAMAELAIDTLVGQIRASASSAPPDGSCILVDYTLVERASTQT